MYNLIKPAIHNCLHLLVHLQQGTVWFHLFPYLFQLLVLIRNHRHLADLNGSGTSCFNRIIVYCENCADIFSISRQVNYI